MLDLSRFVIIKSLFVYGESEQPILRSINILNFVSKYFKQRPHHLNLKTNVSVVFSFVSFKDNQTAQKLLSHPIRLNV